MDSRFKFAVLRLEPDKRRGERINIGIVVFKDDSLDVRLLPSMNKVSAIDGSVDTSLVSILPANLSAALASVHGADEKYSTLVDLRLASVSEMGWFAAADSIRYESEISRLMAALVVPRPMPSRQTSGNARIASELKKRFKSGKILGKVKGDLSKHLVVPNYPLAPNEDLYADFVLKNGVYRVTETADFRANSNSSHDKRRIAADAAIKLDRAKKVFKGRDKLRRYAVVGGSNDGSANHAVNLIGEYSDEVFAVESSADMARYFQMMMEAAHASLPMPT